MVWGEDKVREWSDVAREAQEGNCGFTFGHFIRKIGLSGTDLGVKWSGMRTLISFLFIRNGSLKGGWSFREIAFPIKAGKLLSFKT